MNCYLAKLVFQILCGDGKHTAQFDEQLRIIYAETEELAYEKASRMGEAEEDSFYNKKEQLVQWQFVNVPELYQLNQLNDGAEVYSRIQEVDDASTYRQMIHSKATAINNRIHYPLLNVF